MFSVNQFCFDEQFIKKTISIDSVMSDDLNMLDQEIQSHLEKGSTDVEDKIINQSYKDKLVYERYLDDFNKEFKKNLKYKWRLVIYVDDYFNTISYSLTHFYGCTTRTT